MINSLKDKAYPLFDLDGTLFDHELSLLSGLHVVQDTYQGQLAEIDMSSLSSAYNASLTEAYDLYLSGNITYEEKDKRKIELLFDKLGIPKPTASEIAAFQTVYENAYMISRQATPGSKTVLKLLKEHGYHPYILTNGQLEDQTNKVESIGLANLVDGIFTSQELGKTKPSPEFFYEAIRRIGTTPDKSVMIGDSITSDIEGALSVGITPVLYAQHLDTKETIVSGVQVKIIRNMNELLDLYGLKERPFRYKER